MAAVLAIAFIAVATLPLEATAQAESLKSSSGIFNAVFTSLMTDLRTWSGVIQAAALRIFWALATISLVWMGGQLVMRKGDVGEFFGELIRYMLFIGFFYWLLLNGSQMATHIVDGLKQLGGQAGGTGLDAALVAEKGMLIFMRSIKTLSWYPNSTWLGALISFAILIIMAVVTVNYILIQFTAYFMIYAGVIFLGFGGSRWTSDIAINYFKAALGVGVKLLAMTLLLAAGMKIVDKYYALLGDGVITLADMAAFLLMTLLLWQIVAKVPEQLAGIAQGHLWGNSVGNYGASAGVAAIASGAGMAAAAVSGAGAVAAGAAGVAKAGGSLAGITRAAWSASGGSGSIAATSGGGSPGGSGGGTGSGGIGGSGNRGVSAPLAMAMGGASGAAAASSAPKSGGAAQGIAGDSASGSSINGASVSSDTGSPNGAGQQEGSEAGSASEGSASEQGSSQSTSGWAAVMGGSGSGGSIGGAPGATQRLASTAGTLFGVATSSSKQAISNGLKAADDYVSKNTVGGRIATRVNAKRDLILQGKGVQAQGMEKDPQEEIRSFVRGR